MYQQKAARRHAPPIVAPAAGLPLIKNTASLGRMLEWRVARFTVDEDMPQHYLKQAARIAFDKFCEAERKTDGALFYGKMRLEGPTPHFEVRPNDVQEGDRGGKREIGRNLLGDAADTGKVDYRIHALFDVPEMIQEIPTDLAMELFTNGRENLRPLREKDWRGVLRG